MSCKIICGDLHMFHLPPKPNQLSSTTRTSNLQPIIFNSFNTHVKNPNFFTKESSTRSFKSRTNASINTCEPAQSTESFYELLGISESGSLSEIKKAYKQLARKYHPDVSPADRMVEYTQRFILVQEAYETLADPQTRALYDRDLSKGFHLAFSGRTKVDYHKSTEEREQWKNRWESQVSELKNMRMNNDDSRETWGSRMRRQNST